MITGSFDSLLKKANEPRQIALNGVNWLMQLGFLCGGWLMAKSAHICKSYDLNEYSVDFIEAKVTSAEIYISNCLPLVKYYSEIIRMLQKAGWNTIDSIVFRTEEELKSLRGKEVSSVPLLKIQFPKQYRFPLVILYQLQSSFDAK